LNGYESMGFDVRSLTQDTDQEQFTITTQNPIPVALYDDRYTWAKYGHLILPEVFKLNSYTILPYWACIAISSVNFFALI
jgi:hypothetical protein